MLFQLLVTTAGLWYVFHDPQRRPDTPYSSLIESDVPIVVQHTRLDSRQAENACLLRWLSHAIRLRHAN
jgi:hypothetical protein